MIIKNNRKIIFQVVLAVVIALVLGMYILPIVGERAPKKLWAVLSGLAVISLVGDVRSIIFAAKNNGRLTGVMKELFPKDTAEMRRIGVKTPLDFVFVMGNTTMYRPISPFRYGHLPLRQLGDPILFYRSCKMFREMFGRELLGAKSGDWDYISACEYHEATGKSEEEASDEDFRSLISEDVKDYFANKLQKRIDAKANDISLES